MDRKLLKEALTELKGFNQQHHLGGTQGLIERIESELAKPTPQSTRGVERMMQIEWHALAHKLRYSLQEPQFKAAREEGWARIEEIQNAREALLPAAHSTHGVERMTREVVKLLTQDIREANTPATIKNAFDTLWARIEEIQNAPYVPDWTKLPEKYVGFRGWWTTVKDHTDILPGEFYIEAPAPRQPTDAELATMFDRLPIEKKLAALDAVKEE